MTVDQLLHAALDHHCAGRLREAEIIYRQVLAEQPDDADALHLLGFLAHQINRRPEGMDLIRRALGLRPLAPDFHYNLGIVLNAEGRPEEAIASWRRTLTLRAGDLPALVQIGGALESMGRVTEAAETFRQLTQLHPDSADAWARLGGAHQNLGNIQECTVACRRALSIDPRCALAHYLLGTALKEQGQIREAIASYRRSLVHDPQFLNAFSNILYSLHFDPDATAREIYHEHCLFNAVHARPLERNVRPHANDASPERRLRIGYVSPDFRAHSTSLFTSPLLSAHDRRQFEIYCYSDVRSPDLVTEQIRRKVDTWRNIARLTDEQAAEIIRSDRIDILVDLALHTHGGRPLLFARKAAPVQVTWLAYPGTSGLTAMDYRLTDPWIDPPGKNDAYYFEESIRLPETMWCYEPVEQGLTVGPLPALMRQSKERVTFANLNNFSKVNDQVIEMWAGVLRRVDDSRMLVAAPAGDSRERFLGALGTRGIDPGRIQFVERRNWLDYMAVYNRIDIVLDTFPWNGHTMSLDALWMGVPVISLCGDLAVSRAVLCYLSNLGMPDLVAHTPGEYIDIAVGLAGDLPQLAQIRAALRQKMEQSPLTDVKRFARSVEAAFREMWRRWCAKQRATAR